MTARTSGRVTLVTALPREPSFSLTALLLPPRDISRLYGISAPYKRFFPCKDDMKKKRRARNAPSRRLLVP